MCLSSFIIVVTYHLLSLVRCRDPGTKGKQNVSEPVPGETARLQAPPWVCTLGEARHTHGSVLGFRLS